MATTEDRIIEAAEKLEAEGVNPTQVTVREALGGGSFATIGPILKRWKESKKEDGKLAEVRVPEAITERLEQLQGAVWQAAVEEADRRLVAEREALHQAQEAAASEVREHLDSIAALETEAGDYQRKIETLEETANTLDADRHNALTELATVKERAETDRHAAAEAIIKETERREAAEARAERAEALHREALEQARADLADLKQEAAAQVNSAGEQVQEQAKRAERAEKEAQQRAAGEQACQSRLEAAQRELEQMKERMAKLEEKADTATQEAAELRGEVKALKAEKPNKK
jgi:chromosome segregation ATPase